MDARLEGKVVPVTGGAQGLGAALCRELAAHGVSLVVVDRSDNIEKAAAEFARGAARAVGVRGDVGDERDTARFVDVPVRQFDRLDAVVNNAGTDVTKDVDRIAMSGTRSAIRVPAGLRKRSARRDTLAVDEWDRVLRTNLRGPFLHAKAALPALKRQGGDVVNITSTAAKRSWPNASAYHASKWGLLDRFPDLDPARLQDPADVARTVRFALAQPRESCIAELTVVPLTESSWP